MSDAIEAGLQFTEGELRALREALSGGGIEMRAARNKVQVALQDTYGDFTTAFERLADKIHRGRYGFTGRQFEADPDVWSDARGDADQVFEWLDELGLEVVESKLINELQARHPSRLGELMDDTDYFLRAVRGDR